MSRLFDDASNEYLYVNQAVITAYPIGMACWYKLDAHHTSGATFMWCGDKDVADYFIALGSLTAGNLLRAASNKYGAAAVKYAVTSTNYTLNTWEHAAAIFLGVSERHAYINGGNKGSDTGTVGAMANHDRVGIGSSRDSSPGAYVSGEIAEAAIWDLTNWGVNDATRETNFEKAIASMAKGYTPAHFPLGLKAYWPLVRSLNDKVGGYNLTASGTIVSAHPRVIMPHGAL